MRSKRCQRGQKPDRLAFLILLVLLFCLPSAGNAVECGCDRDIRARLAQEVSNYSNAGVPLIPTLLSVADAYNLPMGIEQVTQEALERPVEVKLEHGTLSRLLDLCVEQLPGYSWAMRDEVVNVFGPQELTQASNLFNLVVPSFGIHDQTLNDADEKLRMTAHIEVDHPKGIVGSYLPSFPLEGVRMTFAARNVTVREILNCLVRLHGKSVWIARVPPEGLSGLPQAGLWKLLPHSTHDPRLLLEPGFTLGSQKAGNTRGKEKTDPVRK